MGGLIYISNIQETSPLNIDIILPYHRGSNRRIQFMEDSLIGVQSHDAPTLREIGDRYLSFYGEIYSENNVIDRIAKIVKGASNLRTVYERHEIGALLSNVDGSFSIVIAEEDEAIAVRDPIGGAPLYIGQGKSSVVISAEKRPLIHYGLLRIRSFPPGCIAYIKGNTVHFKRYMKLEFKPEIEGKSIDEIADELISILGKAFKRRLKGSRVAVSFSGGIDSSVTARMLELLGAKPTLITISSALKKDELSHAIKAAKALGMDHIVREVDEGELKRLIPEITFIIEEANVMKAGVGIAFLLTSREAFKSSIQRLFTGQGSDELFCGYNKFIHTLREKGAYATRRLVYELILKAYDVNLERDFKACISQKVYVLHPFMDIEVLEFSLRIPLKYKIASLEDKLRKRIVRKVGSKLGLPDFIIKKPKKAVQYGTGIDKIIRKTAKKLGYKYPRQYLQDLYEILF
ncbi:hypothetical protein DRO02_04870 [archaeon]|nr:MAG: hypothetical protein DRO02_04870 [archaeon]RLG64430.1 MAG: hypothetical protein DRO21_03980 [archaeon]RLG66663.1 MAG: hypothetical protein DRN89_00435 [archaeon]HDM23962.1 asparagine synthetase B [Candidatus Bathyarchaeota archaeon]